jgi:hypothetical protein
MSRHDRPEHGRYPTDVAQRDPFRTLLLASLVVPGAALKPFSALVNLTRPMELPPPHVASPELDDFDDLPFLILMT